MNLPEALTEAARVAVAERERWYILPLGAGYVVRKVGVWLGAKDYALSFDEADCQRWIASRVNAAVFAWWAENWARYSDVSRLTHSLSDQFAMEAVFKALASGEAS